MTPVSCPARSSNATAPSALQRPSWAGDGLTTDYRRRDPWNDGRDEDDPEWYAIYLDMFGRMATLTEPSYRGWFDRLTPEDLEDDRTAGFISFMEARMRDRDERARIANEGSEERRKRMVPEHDGDSEGHWQGYLQAAIRLTASKEPQVLKAEPRGFTSGDFPFDTTAHILTAYNPFGRVVNNARNQQPQQALFVELQGLDLPLSFAQAGDLAGKHQEPSLIVIGLDDMTACAIGHSYQQDAIFRWTRHSFNIVGCHGQPPSARGWTCLPEPFGQGKPNIDPHRSDVVPTTQSLG